MSNVLPLTRWKDKRLAEREECSDVQDSEDEESDVEDFTVPKKARKRNIGFSDRKVKSHDCRSRKSFSEATGARASPPPWRPR